MKVLKYFIIALVVNFFTVGLAFAKLNPIKVIEDRAVRPNILIVLDTSGSMQWETTSSTTVGGDNPRSRMYIAKNVIRNVLDETRNIANYGLMTYHQDHYGLNSNKRGYFPYHRTAGTSVTKESYFSRWELSRHRANSGWPNFQPKTSFTTYGTTYTLRATNNSKYERSTYGGMGGRRQRITVDHDYCGYTCPFDRYTWTYKGSYYTYSEIPQSGTTVYYFDSFLGKQFTQGDDTYVHYDFSTYPVVSSDPPIAAYTDGGVLLVSISTSVDQADQDQKVNQMLSWMNLQNHGGLVATGYTPTGETLNDAYSYFVNSLIPSDSLSNQGCRKNFILLVTDGQPKVPNESEGYSADKAYKAAEALKNNNPPINTFVVGFCVDKSAEEVLKTVAQKGGTDHAYFATDEAALEEALKKIIYEAAAGDYATISPATATSSGSKIFGNVGILGTAEFPDWQGHLKAIDLVNNTLRWDAGEVLRDMDYRDRKVYTSGPSGNLVKFKAENAAELHNKLDLGASKEEAEEIINFILGKDRDWKLGDIINSHPIAVGPPYTLENDNEGHSGFESQYKDRKTLIYVGSNDGMLHAFDLSNGDEVFAYIPPDLLPKLGELYLNNGQPADPEEHIYFVAGSPKVADVKIKVHGDKEPTWHTVLICGEGPGGHNYFALDVTNPSADPPFKLLWHTGDKAYSANLGETWCTPAFGKIKDKGKDKWVILVGSGYGGKTFYVIDIETGKPIYSHSLGATLLPDTVCYTVNGYTTNSYQIELGGRLWEFNSGNTSHWTTGSPRELYNAGPRHPFYYSPAIKKMEDKDIYLIAAASGTYDDPDLDPDFVPNIYILTEHPTGTSSWTMALYDLGFSENARIITSPVIINNNGVNQALFLVYEPPATIGCEYGKSYLVVIRIDVNSSTGDIEKVEMVAKKVVATGKATGIGIAGGGSHVIVGKSGHGPEASADIVSEGGKEWPPIGQVRALYWRELF